MKDPFAENQLSLVELDELNETNHDFTTTTSAKLTPNLGTTADKVRTTVILSEPVIRVMNEVGKLDSQDGSSVIRAALALFRNANEQDRLTAYELTQVKRDKRGAKPRK